MPFLQGLAHLVGDVASPLANGAGAVTGINSLTDLGHNIGSPTATLSNPAGLLSGNNPAFTGLGAYGGSTFNIATAGKGAQGGATGGVADNAATASGNYTGGAGAATSGSSIDPTTGLSYDDLAAQANSQLGNLGQQQTIGNQNINDAYTSSLNTLLGQKATTDRNYNTSKAQTLQDYTQARGNEQAQVGQQANSLQRLLGSHGYQGSANTAAAYAAARQGSVANQALEQGFGRNQQALDTNYGDYNNQYNSSVGSLDHQKQVQQNQLQAQVDANKQSLLQQLAQISTAKGGNASAYTPQINQLGQQITQLGQQYASPVIQATPPVYQAPNLESYTVPGAAAPAVNQAVPAGAASNVNPFLSVLLGGQDKNKQLGA